MSETERGKKQDKKKINDFRVWTQTKNLKGNDIVFRATDNQRTIKHYSSVLNEEESNPKINNRRTNKKAKESNIIPSDIEISDDCRKILTDIYKNINHMKKETQEITKMNSLYLQETAKDYFSAQNNNTNINAYNEMDFNKKSKKPINYIYINDNYRRQINKAFNTFNPYVHLAKLNAMKSQSDKVKAHVEDIKDKIEEDIKNLTSKDYFKKKYEKVHKETLKMKSKNVPTSGDVIISTMNKTSSTAFKSMGNTRTGFKKQKYYTSPKKKLPDYKEKECKCRIIYNTI